MKNSLTGSDIQYIKRLQKCFQACIDAAEERPADIPNRETREKWDTAYIYLFDHIRDIHTDEMTGDQIALISNLNIVYVSYKVEFSQTPREFNADHTSAVLEWTLSQRKNPIFKINPELLVCALLFRGMIGLGFARRNAATVLADFDEALRITDAVHLGVDLLKSEVEKYRAYALAKVGNYNAAEAANLESLRLLNKHEASSHNSSL